VVKRCQKRTKPDYNHRAIGCRPITLFRVPHVRIKVLEHLPVTTSCGVSFSRSRVPILRRHPRRCRSSIASHFSAVFAKRSAACPWFGDKRTGAVRFATSPFSPLPATVFGTENTSLSGFVTRAWVTCGPSTTPSRLLPACSVRAVHNRYKTPEHCPRSWLSGCPPRYQTDTVCAFGQLELDCRGRRARI